MYKRQVFGGPKLPVNQEDVPLLYLQGGVGGVDGNGGTAPFGDKEKGRFAGMALQRADGAADQLDVFPSVAGRVGIDAGQLCRVDVLPSLEMCIRDRT